MTMLSSYAFQSVQISYDELLLNLFLNLWFQWRSDLLKQKQPSADTPYQSLHTLIYTQEIGNIALEPQGAALTVPKGHASLSGCILMTGWVGK